MKYFDMRSIPKYIYIDTDAIYYKTKKGKDNMKKVKFKVGDMVRILDGSKIKDFCCGYMSDMKNHIGEVHEITRIQCDGKGYRLKDIIYTWDERCLEKVEELYVVSVSGRTVCVVANGEMAQAKCNPEDKFDLAKGISLAIERLNVIREGDWVEVVNPGHAYPLHTKWLSENIDNKELIARFKYGEDTKKYMRGKVIKIAPHGADDDRLAYIDCSSGCYLISVDALEKVKAYD